jgi:hypothetical protein
MTPSKRNTSIRVATLAGAVAIVAGLIHWSAREPTREGVASAQARDVPPQVDQILRGMSQHLAGMRAFRVDADSSLEAVLDNGQKLQFLASSQITVRRPDRLRSERRGPEADLVLYYDGNAMTLFGRRQNLYATTPAPHSLDEAIDFARNELDIEAPGADLLASDVYTSLMEDVRSAVYVGEEMVDERNTHHLAFRNRGGTDWQIWVTDGADPLPVRYVIVSTDVRSQPELTVALHDWDTQAAISDADFQFEAPAGAHQIEFRRASEMASRARSQHRQRVQHPQGE